MRKSVLTGVLACALLFVVTAQKAEAAPVELFNAEASDRYSVLVALANVEPKVLVDEPAPEVVVEVPVIVHVVDKGQSLTDIAEIHQTNWERLFDKNTEIENPDYIEVGMEITIPTEEEEIEKREIVIAEPELVARTTAAPSKTTTKSSSSSSTTKVATVSRGSSSGNSYVGGQCTWHVKNLRPELPNNLGNARTWSSRAAAQGLATGSTPRAGAVAQRIGGNHVAVVLSVNSDGTINISEMNFNGGLYKVNYRTVNASGFTYIY